MFDKFQRDLFYHLGWIKVYFYSIFWFDLKNLRDKGSLSTFQTVRISLQSYLKQLNQKKRDLNTISLQCLKN